MSRIDGRSGRTDRCTKNPYRNGILVHFHPLQQHKVHVTMVINILEPMLGQLFEKKLKATFIPRTL
jgi:hypothetical protein